MRLASPLIFEHLTNLFNLLLRHAYIPRSISDSYITPVLKDSNGSKLNSNNYRPIAVSSVFSKLFESLLKERLEPLIRSSDNQFSFKPSLGTETCVFLLKEAVRHYIDQKSPVLCTFLDASEAFDKVTHSKLVARLIDRSVPSYLIDILRNWYSEQFMVVRWDRSIL